MPIIADGKRQEDGEEESSAQSPPQVGNQNKAKEWQLFAAQAFADFRPSSQGELLMGILLHVSRSKSGVLWAGCGVFYL